LIGIVSLLILLGVMTLNTSCALLQTTVNPCAVEPTTLHRVRGPGRWTDEKVLPFTGKMIEESHLRTIEDTQSVSCPSGGILQHLARNCAEIKKVDPNYGWTDCTKLFNASYERQWTPPEPNCAEGSVSRSLIDNAGETWTVNFMAKLPREKWLVSGPKGSVVVATGLEIGPGDQNLLGGAQPAVHWFAGTSNEEKMTVHGKLADQSLPLGPIKCQ
jgi:hypothetical protein